MIRIQQCPASVLTTAIQQGQFKLVKELYDERELKYWPRPKDTSVLVKLVFSDDEPAQSILKHIVRCRKVRYHLNANEKPVYDDWIGQLRTSRPLRRWGRSDTSHHVFTSVSIITGANGIADVLADLISTFLLPAPELRFSDMEAVSCGYICWLTRFSILQNEHMDLAAEHGKLDEARCMHEQLAREDRLVCSKRFLQLTIENGDLPYVKWHASNCHCHSTEALVFATTWTGQQHIIEWIQSDQFEVCRLWIPDTEYLSAAGIGSPTELQWLRAYWSRNGTAGLVDEAARHGFLSVFRWWRANGFEWFSSRTMDVVARYGHLSLLQWLHENQVEGCSSSAMDWAARKGHLVIVKWLHTHRSEGCSVKPMDWAAKNGEFAMVSWLHANRPEGSSTDAMDWAAANGNLMMLKWLHENRTEGCTRFAIDNAAQNDHWVVVVWLLEHRDEGCTVSALVSAVRSHQLEVAKMLYDRPELRSFPTPDDAHMLVDLIDFNHPDDRAFLSHVVSCRSEHHTRGIRMFPRFREATWRRVYTEEEEKHEDDGAEGVTWCRVYSEDDEEDDDDDESPTLRLPLLDDSDTALSRIPEMSETDFWYSEMEMVDPEEAILLHKKFSREDQITCGKRFLQVTLEIGDLEFVKWHALRCPCHSIKDLVYAATWVGRQDVINWVCLDWLHIRRFRSQKSRSRCGENVISPSVETPFTVLEERYSSELEIREALMDFDERAALRLGRDDDLEGIPVTIRLLDMAATRGHLNIVTHLQSKQIVSCTVIGVYGAIKGGHHQILSCLYSKQNGVTNWPRRRDEGQVLHRFLDPVDKKMLQLFRHHLKMRLPARDLEMATYRNDFDRVRLICELDLVEDIANSISIAAVQGNMPMLETLHSNLGLVRYSALALDGAAEEGYLSIVRYLDKRRAPRTRTAVDLSAANGHYDVVFYLIERGNRCSPFALYLASLNGHTNIVMYLAKRSSMAMVDVERCIEVTRNRENSELLEEYRLSMRPTMWSSTRLHRRHRRRHVRALNVCPFRSRVAYFMIEQLLSGQLVRQCTVVVASGGGGIFLGVEASNSIPSEST